MLPPAQSPQTLPFTEGYKSSQTELSSLPLAFPGVY